MKPTVGVLRSILVTAAFLSMKSGGNTASRSVGISYPTTAIQTTRIVATERVLQPRNMGWSSRCIYVLTAALGPICPAAGNDF